MRFQASSPHCWPLIEWVNQWKASHPIKSDTSKNTENNRDMNGYFQPSKEYQLTTAKSSSQSNNL